MAQNAAKPTSRQSRAGKSVPTNERKLILKGFTDTPVDPSHTTIEHMEEGRHQGRIVIFRSALRPPCATSKK